MEALVIGLLAVFVGVLIGLIVLYERELRRIAHFLKAREKGSNERVSVEFATRGVCEVASEVNKELDVLRDAYAEQERRQQAFRQDLSSLSHDIRTPLAGAQGYLQLYERTRDSEEQKRCLKEAAARLGVMRELTDQLFDYAKAIDDDNALTIEPVEVLPVIAQVLAGMYPQFAEKQWDPILDFEDERMRVLANSEALLRVFSNLLTNTLRYGSAAPHIVQREMRIAVSNRVDQSSSLDPDKLFERFYQAEASRTSDGSGLGLAIVARLCDRMGAKVSARLDEDELVIEICFQGV